MKGQKQDLTGKTFGRLFVVRRAGTKMGNVLWLCKCSCGNEKVVMGSNLRGKTESCGCYRKETHSTHGMSKHPLFYTWRNMRRRCGNTDYGEIYAGVTMHKPWEWFPNFVKYVDKYLGKKPTSQHTLDRVDNLGSYVPGNIRWASKEEQSNNRRSVRLFTYRGEKGTARYFSKKYKVRFTTLCSRLWRGMTICQALETPLSEPHIISSHARHYGQVREEKEQTEE